MALKANIKFKFLKALRSGKYKQTRNYLSTGPDTYCVLGVLAKEAGVPQNGNAFIFPGRISGENKKPTSVFLASVGLTGSDASDLMGKNDTAGYSFDDLANYIEANL